MSGMGRRTTSWVAVFVGVVAIGVQLDSATEAGAKKKRLKVSCEQLYAEIETTGAQLQAQYNAMGFTIGLPDPAYPTVPPIITATYAAALDTPDSATFAVTVRAGAAGVPSVTNDAVATTPGETNPAIREYDWFWGETVVSTKKGALRDTVTDFRCEKYTYDGGPGDPHNIQTFPC